MAPPATDEPLPRSEAAPRREGLLVAALLGGSLLLRGLVAWLVPLLEAEAYYWTWSQRLDVGYVDHPPAIAVLLRLTTDLGGLTPLAARAGPLVLGTVGAWLFHRWCRGLLGPAVALRCLLVFCVGLCAFPFGILALPDAPLHLFWVACLVAFTAASRRPTWGRWLLLGLLTGLCILAKYNGFLLFGVYGLALVASAEGRRQLASPAPWAGVALALAVAAPNLLWDGGGEQAGATLATPLREGVDVGSALSHLGQLLALPLVLLGPVLGIAFAWRCVAGVRAGRLRRDPVFRLLACASVAPFAVFAGVSLLTQVHVHWPATAFLAAVPLTLAPGPGPSPRVLRWGIGTTAGLTALLVLLPVAALLAPLEDPPEAVRRLRAELGSRPLVTERLRREVAALDDGRLFLVSRDYHLTALMEWMTGGRVPGLPLLRRRFRQYEVWYDEGDLRGWSALVLVKGGDSGRDRRVPVRLREAFDRVSTMPPLVVSVDGVELLRWELYVCRGFRGPL